MDVTNRLHAASAPEPARPLIDPGDLRCILSNLSQMLCRPLESLRAGFHLLLGEEAKGVNREQREHVTTMAVLCDDLVRLTKCYLDYAGLVQGTLPLEVGAFTVAAMIREIDREFGPVAADRRITWECSLEGADATVFTDASRCQRIFGNLVANALKYTGEGGHVRVASRAGAAFWTVTVADDGPGIPPEHVAHVFEPFFRLPRDGHAGCEEGNGLGLAVCREMVGQLGGSIDLGPAPGDGTLVTVRFPRDAKPEAGRTA